MSGSNSNKDTVGNDKGPASGPVRSETRIQQLLADSGVSYWLKGALPIMLDRDPIDALNDAEILVEVLTARLAEIQGTR
jgi:hypothetical protein